MIEVAEFLIVPSLYLDEVFNVILREKSEDQAFLAIAAMQEGKVVDLDTDPAIEAAATGREKKLTLADPIVFVVAQKHSAILWSQDAHFSGKPGLESIPKAK